MEIANIHEAKSAALETGGAGPQKAKGHHRTPHGKPAVRLVPIPVEE